MKIERVNLSKAMYEEAKEKGTSFTDVLERQARKENKFSADAEAAGLDIIGQQLAARDLRISGAQASFVEDFYRTTDSSVLFPAVIAKAVRAGLDDKSELRATTKELVGTRTGIDSGVYQSAEVDVENSTATSKRVAEGKEFPKVKIQFKDKSLKLHKNGYELEMTYEVARRMKINLFNTVMKQLGRNINRDKVRLIVQTLINGDGNDNPITGISSVNADLAYSDVVDLKYAAKDFDPSIMLANETLAKAYECLDEYTSKTGPTMPAPPKVCDVVPDKKMLVVDNKISIEEVYEKGGSLVEHDKIIDKQFEKAVVSEVVGYAILYRDASRMLTLS